MLSFNKRQLAKFSRLAQKFSLDLAVLFGSQVKNKTNGNSDVDIAVLPRKDLDLPSYSLLVHSLGKNIGNYNIDLVVLKHASPLLLGQIAKNCQLLYERKKGLFQSFRLSAMKKYVDALPIFRIQEQYLRRQIKEFKKELNKND